jgi:ribonuclease Z
VQQAATRIRFLGSSSAVPDDGNDTASFVINDRYLVDTGWSVVGNLRAAGVDPLAIEYVIFTHLHHDHYLSLPALLFYWRMKKKSLSDLAIIGPDEDLRTVVDLALGFLRSERFFPEIGSPSLIPLVAGGTVTTPAFDVATCASRHPVAGLCYRFTDRSTGRVVSFSGDTAYHPPVAAHVRGSDLLIHEASLGPGQGDPAANPSLHSGAIDAARIADAAKVERLVLVHGPRDQAAASIAAARQVFPNTAEWPAPGDSIVL